MITQADVDNKEFPFINALTPEVQERFKIGLMFVPPYPKLGFALPTEIEELLFDLWHDITEDLQIDHEFRYRYETVDNMKENQNVWDDPIYDLRRAEDNANRWIADAKTEFMDEVDFMTFSIANKEIYGKHYKNPKWDTEKVTRKSSSKAVLNQDLTDMELTRIYQEVICANLEYFLDTNELLSFDFAVDINSPTGYSRGQECTKLLYKLDRTTKMFHPYPITDSEAQKKDTLVYKKLG